ncbi:kinase-like domain-containing protein [Blakeslea trispora]|nr:kinase-like domain-containing protein [Blakeslea trispora]
MSNALLLRLFTSEYFNAWIAISYIFRHPDNVGIQHYLCTQLRKFPIAEIEFFLPQLMHLLITRPTESVALELYIVDTCEKSTHIAVMCLWYLQAYLSDLSANPNHPSFQLCKRVFNRCQTIIFADISQDIPADIKANKEDIDQAEEPSPNSLYAARLDRTQRVRENALPALVGMGALLAGIGQPCVTRPVGSIAIAQGRKPSFQTFDSSNLTATHRSNTCERSDVMVRSQSQPHLPISTSKRARPHSLSSALSSILVDKDHDFSVSLEDLHKGKAFSISRYLKQAQQKIQHTVHSTLISHDNTAPLQLMGSDGISSVNMKAMAQSSVPSSQDEPSTPTTPTTPFTLVSPSRSFSSDDAFGQSPPKAPASLDPRLDEEDLVQNSSDSDDDEVYALAKLSLNDRRQLLRSNYFRSEMQFLLALVDIATRLVIVPKPARLSALHAELTLLNHNLPAEICMPLWCPATVDRPYHHRIVRISPTDAVVLNSAERAPYLLMIEVLDDELSLENGFKSSLSKLKKNGKNHHLKRLSTAKRKEAFEDAIVDLGDLGSPISARNSLDITPSISTATTATAVSYNKSRDSTDSPVMQEEPDNRTNEKEPLSSFDDDAFAERMKTAAILLAQLQLEPQQPIVRTSTESIRQKIIAEMMALEDDRMEKMTLEGVARGIGGGGGEGACNAKKLDDEQRVALVVNKEDPSAVVFSEDWETKKERIRAASPYGHLPNWRLISVIVKNGADLRQEQFAIQLIREMQKIWQDTKVNVWVQYIRVLVTSDDSGLIETVKNSISIHSIKKEAYTRKWNEQGAVFSLKDYFVRRWGPIESPRYKKAQDAFMRSLAGYSVASYLLQIKDRHNGNLLLDDKGHIIHIDFGFILSNSPGSVGFEMAPFKLPQEYVDILGGVDSPKFNEYKSLTKAAFLAVRKHSDNILLLTEMMSKDSKLPCFQNGTATASALRDRFQLQLTETQVGAHVEKLIVSSCCNVFTRLYDTYQYYSQGIL